MRILISAMGALIGISLLVPSAAAKTSAIKPREFSSLQDVVAWLNEYRKQRNPDGVPVAIQALSRFSAFRDPEASGVYVGFAAGVIGSNQAKAEALIDKMLPMRSEDTWVVVRAIAYSGSPRWKELLRHVAPRIPERQPMIDKYLDGKLATLDMLEIKPTPTTMQALRADMDKIFGRAPTKKLTLDPNQTVLDVLWGYYLGSGSYGPVFRIIQLLPWSKDRDHTERLTIGSMAKFTLATNASRDPVLMNMLKSARKARQQSKETVALLNEVIEAAEVADAGRLRAESLQAIETLKTKGPASKQEMMTWARVGTGTLALGCVVAAALGQIEFGIPCVIGGGLSSAAMYYYTP